MNKYPKRGGDCEYTMDCMWGVDGWCDRPVGRECVIEEMEAEPHLDKPNTENEWRISNENT